MAVASQRLESDLRDYEQRFLARYAAVLEACPEEDAARATKIASVLSTLTRVNFARYWLSSQQDFDATMANIGRWRAEHVREIRATWPADRCARTRQFGRQPFDYLYLKLKPYAKRDTRDDWQSFAHRDRLAWASMYIFEVAVAFEIDARPEMAETFEKLDAKFKDDGPEPAP
jgi:hypothetical protein